MKNSLSFNPNQILLTEVINDENISNDVKYEKIYSLFKKINNYYYPRAFLYINNALIKILFETYPEFALSENGDEISKEIENNLDQVALLFMDKVSLNNCLTSTYLSDITSQIMSIEYEARKTNKALLFRGTSEIVQCVEGERLLLLGSTMREYLINQDLYARKDCGSPYSISFGNSLFAGLIHDYGACSYWYLNLYGNGYSLFINKKDYMQHQCCNLFYIAPLCAFAGLLGYGEWFHSRSKAAIAAKKKNEQIYICGLFNCQIANDSAGVILIERDPFEQAELFSQYIADNMRLITIKSPEEQSPEHILTLKDYKENQDLLAKYYAVMRIIQESKAQSA